MPVFEIVLHATGALLLLVAGGLDVARETSLTARLAAAAAGPGVVFRGHRAEDGGATHVWTFAVPATLLSVPALEPDDGSAEDDHADGTDDDPGDGPGDGTGEPAHDRTAPAPAEALRVLREALRLTVLDLVGDSCPGDLRWSVHPVPATETP